MKETVTMKKSWALEELEDIWTLGKEELKLIAKKNKNNRIGFAIMFKYFQIYSVFPTSIKDIPESVFSYIVKQLVKADKSIKPQKWNQRTAELFRREIRSYLGFREYSEDDKTEVYDWLINKVLPEGNHSISYISDKISSYLKHKRIEPFSKNKMNKCIQSALNAYENGVFQSISASLTEIQINSLHNLVEFNDKQDPQSYYLRHLKKDSGNVSLESILEEVRKIKRISEIGLHSSIFDLISPRILEKYKTRIMAESPSEIRDHKSPKNLAMLAIFCYTRGQEIIDNLVELLTQVIHKIGKRSESKVNKRLISELKKVSGKQGILADLAQTSLDNPDGIIKEVVFPVVSPETLQAIIKDYKSTGTSYKEQVHTLMRASYGGHYRRMLAPILNTISFQSNNTIHQPVLKALQIIKDHLNSQSIYYPQDVEIPIKGVIKPSLHEIIVEKVEGDNPNDKVLRINRINYEIAVLKSLRGTLRCKEIWVKGAHRYRNPDNDLPNNFEEKREQHYAALNHPIDAEAFTSKLQQEMKDALNTLDKEILSNEKVKILPKKGGYISLSPLEAQAPPPNLKAIKKQIFENWSTIGLLDMLKETEFRTGFMDSFSSTASREYMDYDDLKKRLLLCIFAYGTNTGLKRISASNPDVTYEELRYVRRRFMTKENLRRAITEVVNAIFSERQEVIFGCGTASLASDSKKVGVWDQNLLTEWHVRYQGRGIMIYWHIDRKSALIFSQLKSCSSSEVAHMIQGVLHHCTDMEVQRNYVDSHGQSAVGFAFSYMLGFDLLPRIKAIYKEKLYRPEAGRPDDFKNLQNILSRPIRWDLIQEQYDLIVKFTTALRLGTADAESILRRFTSNNAQHPVYQALIELGKAVKTIFLCRYLNSEDLRREIHEGLNVIESSNNVNDFILYGKSGEISTNRREDQEMTMLCLHLLQNSVSYLNTMFIQSVCNDNHWTEKLTIEDKRAINPLFFEHINPYGLFLLDLNARIPISPIPINKSEVSNDKNVSNAA